jgi:ABC-type Fe3+ transport system substrate-binding protein
VACLALALVAMAGMPALSEEAGVRLLAELVRNANTEGRLTATVQSSWSRAMLPRLIDGFKKRFGLTIEVTATPVAAARQFPIEIAASKAGAPPTYDVMQGDDAESIQLTGAGGVQSIAHWQELLRVVNPEIASGKVTLAQVSHGPFEGSSFMFMANIKLIIYNAKLIGPADLPTAHAELAEPKYKGKFVQPPWTSHWEIAPRVFDEQERDKWLDVVRAAGRNGTVLSEVEGVSRVALGQYSFVLAQDAYLRQMLAKDAKAPIQSVFFRDYNELNSVYYSVRTRTRAPAAATLWALWMTTAKAQSIWQPDNKSFQPYGSSDIDVAERRAVTESKAPVIGYLDNDRTIALLRWQQTPDGARYLAAMAKAIQGE